jgi:hypothetical protein
MKLGASYNSFDNEELLEKSCATIRPFASYISVVYQEVSNFGIQTKNPRIKEFYLSLKEKGLVDELIPYTPKKFTPEEKMKLVSKAYTGDVAHIMDQFCNEVLKREIGRLHSLKNGCTHHLSLDNDEFYLPSQFKFAMNEIQKHDYDLTACKMRIMFKYPYFEFSPPDDLNAVPFICKIIPQGYYRLDEPAPILLDPTRKITNYKKFHAFTRGELEMYHMSFVRKDMRQKMENTSNKLNMDDVEDFLAKFDLWDEDMLDIIVHPMNHIGKQFKEIKRIPNHFGVDLKEMCQVCCVSNQLTQCTKCNQKYCSVCVVEHKH